MRKNRTNNLDEMQDQKLLKMEEYGFWIMFWALAIAIVVQLIIGSTLKEVVGEIAVLLIGSIYIAATSLKNGLWTRTSIPSMKGNAITSIVPAVLLAAIHIIKMIRSESFNTSNVLFTVAIMVAVYVACFAVLEAFRAMYKKRRAELDDIDETSEG